MKKKKKQYTTTIHESAVWVEARWVGRTDWRGGERKKKK